MSRVLGLVFPVQLNGAYFEPIQSVCAQDPTDTVSNKVSSNLMQHQISAHQLGRSTSFWSRSLVYYHCSGAVCIQELKL